MAFLKEEVLKEVISEVFETMFYTDVDFEECAGEGGTFEYRSEASLVNQQGCIMLRMRISEKFARMITANFLGIDEARANEVDEDDLVDSLMEVTNMVAGGCHAHANDSDWKLGIPRAWRSGTEKEDSTRSVCGLGFTFSGEPAGSAVLEFVPD